MRRCPCCGCKRERQRQGRTFGDWTAGLASVALVVIVTAALAVLLAFVLGALILLGGAL